MYTVGDSSSITCTLDRFVFTYAWYDEDGNTVVNGRQLSYSANDSIHHKSFTCSGINLLTGDTEALHIKFVINGNGTIPHTISGCVPVLATISAIHVNLCHLLYRNCYK